MGHSHYAIRPCRPARPGPGLPRWKYIPFSAYILIVARTPTTTDPFHAVAAVDRRELLDALGAGEATVGELVDRLGLSQPQVSKHLGVLRSVDLVRVRAEGRHRWYRVNGPALKSIHEWVRGFERTWNERLDRLDDVLTELEAEKRKP